MSNMFFEMEKYCGSVYCIMSAIGTIHFSIWGSIREVSLVYHERNLSAPFSMWGSIGEVYRVSLVP